MEFEIDDNKLEQVVFRFLDMKNLIIGEPKSFISNYVFFIENENSQYATIKVIKGIKDVICRIDHSLIEDVHSFFSVSPLKSLHYIRKWIEKKLNIEITESYSVSTASRPNYMSYKRINEERNDVISEVRVPRNERVELYKDDNIIVVVPLTHRALKKYATFCKWCINDDESEWEDYHKGMHAVIIQRNPKKEKIGITGNPTASEILIMSRWDEGGYRFEDVCEILGYEFNGEVELVKYYSNITNDINNFAINIVYYSPENGVYDMEDNHLENFNRDINSIPNVTPEIIKKINDYIWRNEGVVIEESKLK